MATTLSASIQRGDFVSDELGELSLDEVFTRLTGHDWGEELRLAVERKFLHKDSCPPGFYLHRPDGGYLALYPASRERFILLIGVDSERGFFGFLGIEKTKTIRLAPLAMPEVEELIRVFATGTTEEIHAAVGAHEKVKGEIVW